MERDTRNARFTNPVVAALDTSAQMRLKESREGEAGAVGPLTELNWIDRTATIVEAASAKIKANDFSPVEALFAGQALALDAMLDKLARDTTVDDIRSALRAQTQCRVTLKLLMQMKNPQIEKFLRKRTVEPAKS